MLKRRTLLTTAVAGAAVVAGISPALADTMADIKKRGEMVVGMEAAYVPFESFDNGKIVGYDCDIGTHIADALGVKVKFVDTEWAGIIPALLARKFDVIISGMTITQDRMKKVLFSMPYADASNVILLRAGETNIKTAEDLSGKRVGAQLGSAGAQVAAGFEKHLKGEGKPGYTATKLYEHYPEAYQDLINGRLDAVINSVSTLNVVMHDTPGKFRTISGIQDIKAYDGIAFRPDDVAFRDFVNGQLAAMKQSGELSKLQQKWFGATMETPASIPAQTM